MIKPKTLLLFVLSVLLLCACSKDESNPNENPSEANSFTLSGSVLVSTTEISAKDFVVSLYQSIEKLQIQSPIKSVSCDNSGKFSLNNLAKGSYYLDAWLDLNEDKKVSDGDFYAVYGEGNYPNHTPRVLQLENDIVDLEIETHYFLNIPENPNISPPTITLNNYVPTMLLSFNRYDSEIVTVLLNGVYDHTSLSVVNLTYNESTPNISNIYVLENNIVKGIKLDKVSANSKVKVDFVFVVDASGSTSQMRSTIKATFMSFASLLDSYGIEASFGFVGFTSSIAGALNLTDKNQFDTFINQHGTTPFSMFGGQDAIELKNHANGYASGIPDENGVVATSFAVDYFSWNSDALRIFLLLTDEPTSVDNNKIWNADNLVTRIIPRSTIHTVYLGDTLSTNYNEYNERPWILSERTGGVKEFFTFQDLSTLNMVLTFKNIYRISYRIQPKNQSNEIAVIVKDVNLDGRSILKLFY